MLTKLQVVEPNVVIDNTTSTVIIIGSIVQLMYNDPTVSVVFAGMAGGAVRWYSEREHWKTGVGSIIMGGICAKYLGPFALGLMESMIGIKISDEAGTTGAFMMGLLGILLIRYIMDKFKYRTEVLAKQHKDLKDGEVSANG